MKTRYRLQSAAVWLCTLAAAPAWAGIQVSGLTTYQEGGATANADTGGAPITQTVSNSDSIQGLRFDFTAGGSSAALNMPLTANKTGTYVVLSVRAPLDNKLSLQIIGSNDQLIACGSLCKIDRSAASLDDLGWSRHTLSFTLPANVTVKALKLLVDGAPHNKGVAYVRSVQILPYVPSSAYPITPSPAIGFTGVAAEAAPGASASALPAAPVYSGDAFQTLRFGFTGLNQMVSLNMPLLDQGLASRLDTSYVRFKMNLPASHQVYLRVVDKDGEVFPFYVNRKQTPPDIQGWTTHVVKLYSHGGAWGGTTPNKRIDLPLKEVRLVVNSASSTAVNGQAYFKDVDLLDHAPSPFETLGTPPYLATNPAAPMASASMAVASVPANNAVAAGQDAIRSFKFTPTESPPPAGLTSGGMAIGVQVGARPVAGQTLRFQAKVPRGYDLNLQFNDEHENTFDVRAIRPLSVVDDAGWVEYAVKLESSSATPVADPIRRLRFIVSTGWVNGIVAARTGTAIQEVETQVRSLYLDETGQAEHPLDLVAGTPVSADWRAVYPDPLLNTGVAAPVQSASLARDMGFRKLRFELYWEAVEKVRGGPYDFSTYLPSLTTLLQLTPSVDPIIILDYNNQLYSPTGTGNSKDEIVDGSANQTAFLNYVTAAATKLAQTYTAQQLSRITFEIWNEENADSFWVPLSANESVSTKANHYAQLLAKATARIKAVSPNFKVVSGGLAQPTYYTQFDTTYLKVLQQANVFGAVDMIGFHPYQHHTPELKAVELAGVSAYFQSQGLTLPFAVTEVGTSSRMKQQDGTNPETLGKQARVQLRQVLSSWATNKPMHVLYSLADNPLALSTEEQYFGLLDKDGHDKPAAKAIRQLFGFANGRKLEGMVNGSPTRVQAMKFSADDKETVFVAWSDYGTPAEGNAITTVLNCNRSVQTACVTDMVGASLEASCTAIGTDGRVRCPVTEAAGPVFVRVARP